MTTKSQGIDAMKDAMLAPWIAGNFGAIAKTIGMPEAEGFVARLALQPGARVLDIACGTGNVTLPLARRGGTVTGLDMTRPLLEEARAWAASEGLDIRFDEGFAEELPYPDASFDVVVSMFGIMFSPFPEIVAAEMARVLRPGGRLALANWTQAGFGGKMGAVVSRHLPAPPFGAISPFLWGDDATVRDRLTPGFASIETSVVPITWALQEGGAATVAFFIENAGPIQLALGRLDPPKQALLLRDLEQFWIDSNIAEDGQNQTLIPNEYLQTLAIRR